jgi:hypothetical protein
MTAQIREMEIRDVGERERGVEMTIPDAVDDGGRVRDGSV